MGTQAIAARDMSISRRDRVGSDSFIIACPLSPDFIPVQDAFNDYYRPQEYICAIRCRLSCVRIIGNMAVQISQGGEA